MMGQVVNMMSLSCISFLLYKVLGDAADGLVKTYTDPKVGVGLFTKLAVTINGLPADQTSAESPVFIPTRQTALVEAKAELDALKKKIQEREETDQGGIEGNLETTISEMEWKVNLLGHTLDDYFRKLDLISKSMFNTSGTYKSHRYFLSKTDVGSSIHTAEGLCQMFGGYLAEIDDQDELSFVNKFLGSEPTPYERNVKIGGNDLTINGRFVFERSDEPVNFTAWGAGQPNSSLTDSCITLINSLMYGTPCYDTNYFTSFLCEVPLP